MEFGDFEELPLIFKCLGNKNARIRDKASEAIEHLWKKNQGKGEIHFRNLKIEKEELDYFRIDFDDETYSILIRIASINHNGFIREKAVIELGRLKNEENLKYVLFRLGDWVSQVRQAALTTIRAYLEPRYVKLLIGQLLMIDRLREIQRTDLAAIQQEIIDFILVHASPEDVSTFNEGVRLRFFRHYFERSKNDVQIATRIFGDSNYLIRLLALKDVSRFDSSFQKILILSALKDRSAPVKMKALGEAKKFLPDLGDEVRTLLLDNAYYVRDFSRMLLKPTGMDFTDFYRQKIESGVSVCGAVLGLCDIGGIENLDIYKKYAFSPRARVSTGCLLALNKFDRQLALQYALDMLGHKSGKVRRTAIGILASQATRESLDSVRKRYVSGDPGIKMASMAVFKRVGGWLVLADLIDSLSDDSAEVRETGWRLLAKWRADATRLFVAPKMPDLERARRSVEKFAGTTNKAQVTYWQEELLKQIAFFIR